MKKLSVIVLGLVAFVGFANAAYRETIVTESVVVSEPVAKVSQVLNMADDTPVILVGNLSRSLGDERYVFRDGTGTMTVKIDDSVWNGVNITEYDQIKIRGEVDRAPNGIEVDVAYIEKI